MTQHTKGPWHTVQTTAHSHPGTTRLDIVSDGAEFSPSYVAGDILPEDARLIAAAPDLLSALQAIAGMRTGPNTDHAQLSALCIAIARAAIAKAEGHHD